MKSLLLTAVSTLGLTAATLAQNVPSYVPTNGLIGWWPFNGNANDESGNGNDGTVNGATLNTDRFDNAGASYSFDGLNDLISITTSTHPTGNVDVTYSIWIYTLNNSGNKSLLNVGDNGMTNKRSAIGREITGGISYVAQANDIASNYFSPLNQWHNIIITKVGESVNFFLDGVLFNFGNINSGQNITNTKIVFGANGTNWGGGEFFNGKLDDIGIWNRALTQQEITNLYNSNVCYQNITVTDTLLINMGITGFNPVTYNNTIKIFPNPANDQITIDYGNFASLNGFQLVIENSLGQQMFQTVINQQTSNISLGTWTGNGLYFVHIIDSQGNTIDIRKILLQ